MKNWAIIVGINEYPRQAGQSILNGAVADACDFADWALDPAGGNVPSERLFFWTYPWPDHAEERLAAYLSNPLPNWEGDGKPSGPPDTTRAPTAFEIVWTAEHLGRKAEEAAREDDREEMRRIYVFLAGHGVRAPEVNDNNIQTCFIAGNFQPHSSRSAHGLIGCESFRKSLLNRRFDEVMMFLDCCRVDGILLASSALPLCDQSNYRGLGSWSTGYASRDNTLAYETEDPPIRGAFSKTLLDGLRTHRDSNTSSLNAEQLARYVVDNIRRHTTRQQFPQFVYIPTDAPLVIVEGAVDPVWSFHPGPKIHLDELLPGTRVLLEGGPAGFVHGIVPLIAGSDPVELPPLPDGYYALVVEEDPDRRAMFKQPRDRVIYVR